MTTPKVLGDRYYGLRQAAWRNLGFGFDKPTKAVEAMTEAGCDYKIEKLPLTAQINTPFGTELMPTDKVMLARAPMSSDDQWRQFGIASEDYTVVQNMDIAQAIDDLSGSWPVDCVGTFQYGKTIFITLDAGMIEIGGEDVHSYFLATTTHDGGTSVKLAYIPIRLRCGNALVTGLKKATVSTAIQHTSGAVGQLRFHANLVNELRTAEALTMNAFEAIVRKKLTQEQVVKVLEAAFPLPKQPKKAILFNEVDRDEIENDSVLQLYEQSSAANQEWEYYCQRALGFQQAGMFLYDRFNDEQPELAETGWAAYNAVAELADYRNGGSSIDESALFGARAREKARAFAEVERA